MLAPWLFGLAAAAMATAYFATMKLRGSVSMNVARRVGYVHRWTNVAFAGILIGVFGGLLAVMVLQ